MIKKIQSWFLDGYSRESIEIQKKSRIFFNIILVLFSLNAFSFLIQMLFSFSIQTLITNIFVLGLYALSFYFIKKNKYIRALNLFLFSISGVIVLFFFYLPYEESFATNLFLYGFLMSLIIITSCIIALYRYQAFTVASISLAGYIGITIKGIIIQGVNPSTLAAIFLAVGILVGEGIFSVFIINLNTDIICILNKQKEKINDQLKEAKQSHEKLYEIMSTVGNMIVNLNSGSREIESAAQEQTSGANQQASGITEVSATLEELTITARQISNNIAEFISTSKEILKTLDENKKHLSQMSVQLEETGEISKNNTIALGELGKRSNIINDMVEIIKDIANKTSILSINASIEAARSAKASSGFSVIASEIRELSKETLISAKNVEKAAREIKDFLDSIILSSEKESAKVLEISNAVNIISDNIEKLVTAINNNFTFSQKIDISINQQESGSKQAAETIKQMAEISRQSAETARQTLLVIKDMVKLSIDLNQVISKKE
ncbi:MAG: hypothetical protein JXB88_00235 [Spirochaetales bacterium]|nr:hypothetical protein [Spirochaetales bacterium]